MMQLFLFIILQSLLVLQTHSGKDVFDVFAGKVYFRSDAPLELIEAESDKIRGLLRKDDQTFAFIIDIESFEGFNSGLQREHFNEHYMESDRYPQATFQGKIIEYLDFEENGNYEVRAKGMLNIHGIEQEKIIKCILKIDDDMIRANTSFNVLLADHDISIPRIVHQKIAEEILIQVEVEFRKSDT